MFGINVTGKFKLKAAGTAVIVKIKGMRAGDEGNITMVRSANGGTVGKAPLIVCETDQFSATGDSNDSSTYSFKFVR